MDAFKWFDVYARAYKKRAEILFGFFVCLSEKETLCAGIWCWYTKTTTMRCAYDDLVYGALVEMEQHTAAVTELSYR